jgi:GNAT superfamily N-acetyltransferase
MDSLIDDLTVRARALWTHCAAAPIEFPVGGGIAVAVSPQSMMCPQGWAGIAVIGDAAIATAPNEEVAATVRRELGGMPIADLIEGRRVLKALPTQRALGPTTLAYLDASDFDPSTSTAFDAVEQVGADAPELRALDASVPQDESDEATILEITSPAFVVREGGRVIAASGYRTWPCRIAHISVITAPDARGRGLAKATGAAAARHALDAGLTPQWRARVPASQHVARALGFREIGTQISVLLG